MGGMTQRHLSWRFGGKKYALPARFCTCQRRFGSLTANEGMVGVPLQCFPTLGGCDSGRLHRETVQFCELRELGRDVAPLESLCQWSVVLYVCFKMESIDMILRHHAFALQAMCSSHIRKVLGSKRAPTTHQFLLAAESSLSVGVA